jgi:hypothetical protein
MPTLNFVRPDLYPKQQAAMYDPKRVSLIEASTKSGKTSSGILWLLQKAIHGLVGQNFWWVAPVSSQSKIAFDRMRRAIQPQDLYFAHLTDRTITLRDNGAVLAFRSGDHPDSLYGEDVYACVIDEASRFKEDAWHAIRSTLTATRGPIRIIGNVKGRKNWFFQLARKAEAGHPEMGYHRLTAYDAVQAGVLEADEIADAKATLPAHVFGELYLAEPADDEGNPFGAHHIRACVGPLSERPAIAWGWDLARKMDWTVGIGLDEEGRVCEALRFQKPWHEQVDIIKKYVGNTPALVDETGVDDPIVEALKLPVRRGGNGAEVIELSCPRLEGYKFTSASKQMLMEGLAMAIHERRVRYPEGPIAQELLSFEYEFTRLGIRYGAPPGMHDDCVCALALAWRCFDDRKLSYDRDLSWIGVD